MTASNDALHNNFRHPQRGDGCIMSCMKFEVKVPTVGESITEGVLAEWKVADGAFVNADDALFELETDKVSMTVTAEKAGRITLSAKAGDTVQIGSVVAFIEVEAVTAAVIPARAGIESAAVNQQPTAEPLIQSTPDPQISNFKFQISNSPPLSLTAGLEMLKANLNDLAPSVRRIVAEERLDPSQIVGTGKGGRITKEDAIQKTENRKMKTETAAPPLPPPASGGEVEPSSTAPQISNLKSQISNRTTRRPMSSLRHRIAERMVESQHNSATLTTFNEVDMSAVMTARAHLQEPFQAKYGIKLGIMSFFIKAAVEALKAVPAVNAQIDGDSIIENHFYDIGVAVSTEKGLVVPVIRDADQLGFAELEAAIAHYAEKARNRTITLDELQGGVFTISNGGVFGSMLSTPILNPPQPAILGLHGIKKRPVVVGDSDQIVVRPMMYLALSYDHRLIDGRESVAFLKNIVECIEMPERLMMGV